MVPGGGDWSKVIGGVLAQPTRNVFAAFYTDDAEGFLTEWDKQGASEAGYKLFGPGALTDEAVLAAVKRAADGVTSAWFWSPDVDSADNKALVDAFPKTYIDDDTGEPVQLSGYAVAMWDAMAALDQVLKQTGGVVSNTEALVAALEGVSFNSPRGAFKFDKATHTPVQDIYIRQVSTSSDGRAANKIVAKIPNVAGPTA
jgi:branched-chain amino acid transport system substrate-binding protein